jgi:hypothetical protein
MVGAGWLIKSSWQRARPAPPSATDAAATGERQQDGEDQAGARAERAEEVTPPRAPEALRAELRAIDAETAETHRRIAMLHSREQEAVTRHDRPGLDSAWAEHDSCLEHLRWLELRREQASRELARQLALEIDRWQELLTEWSAPAPALDAIAERLAELSEHCRSGVSSTRAEP